MFLDGFPALAAVVERRLEEASGRPATALKAWQDYEAALQRRLDRGGSG
jgi:hypothetical protein